jgi:hypothetical protein
MAAMQDTIVAGETLNYVATAADYPASAGWVVTLEINPIAGGTVSRVSSTASGDDHLLQVSAATTAGWTVGNCSWQTWVEKAGERYVLEEGVLRVRGSLIGAAAGTDIRSQAQKALDDANAALAAWTPTQKRYRIGSREMEFNSPADIISVISHWTAAVQREQAAAAMAAGRPNPRKLQVRMGRA